MTRAATDIGAALAKRLASRGAAVIGLDIAGTERRKHALRIERAGCDAADQSSVQRRVADIQRAAAATSSSMTRY